MDKPLALLIARKNYKHPYMKKLFGGSYTLGWLTDAGMWLTWGNAQDKEHAISAANDVIERQGIREVILTSIKIPDFSCSPCTLFGEDILQQVKANNEWTA